ncbi:rab-GTPase-TBC domain-containing protein [Phycomyces nitens]|nr:rab-GTPase-TBC domain-containing protein [Phycomyces nitens]
MESFFVQEKLLQQYLPKLYDHLNDIGLTSDIYSTRWYITLFTGGVVRYQTLLRIWDIYFLRGFDILYIVALVLLKSFQGKYYYMCLCVGNTFVQMSRDNYIFFKQNKLNNLKQKSYV